MTINEVAAPAPSASAPEVEPVVTSQAEATATTATAGEVTDDSPPSPEETAVASFDAALAKAQGKPAEAPPEEAPEEAEQLETEVPEAAKPEEAKPVDLSQPESENVPFEQRKEWQKLVKLVDPLNKEVGKEVRATLRGLMQTEVKLRREVQEAAPHVKTVKHLLNEMEGEIGFRNLVTFVGAVKRDPAGAVPMLEKLLNDAKQRAGMVIQSPDLLTEAQKVQVALDAGEITPEQAAQRQKELTELETHRATTKRTTGQVEAEKRQAQERQAVERRQAEFSEINRTEQEWTEAKSKSDPDFPLVQTLFGKFAQLAATEFVTANKRYTTTAEAKQILEKAYAEAKAEAIKFQPKKRQVTPVRDEGTSRTNRPKPVTPEQKFEDRFDRAVKANR